MNVLIGRLIHLSIVGVEGRLQHKILTISFVFCYSLILTSKSWCSKASIVFFLVVEHVVLTITPIIRWIHFSLLFFFSRFVKNFIQRFFFVQSQAFLSCFSFYLFIFLFKFKIINFIYFILGKHIDLCLLSASKSFS